MSTAQRETEEIKSVPETVDARKAVWLQALDFVKGVKRKRPMGRHELAAASRRVLEAVGLGEAYLGYAMVMVTNAFWLDQFCSVPIERRLLLLPRCLVNLKEVRTRADELGYRSYVADGSPIVVKIIAEENMDAILGVGCLDSLEKAFDKVRQVGIPSAAVPLNCSGCKDTEVDTDFVLWFMKARGPATAERTRNYLPLLRVAGIIPFVSGS